MDLTYRLLNVFAVGDDPFTGNSVCVFDDGSSLTDEQMQALAWQVNNETVFILPSNDAAHAHLRFFSPTKETGFAGSASLATASVVRDLMGGDGNVVLHEESFGKATIVRQGEDWVFRARDAEVRKLKSSPQILSSLVGLGVDAVNGQVMAINAAKSGIVLPVRTVEDVRRAHLDARMLHSYAMLQNTEPQIVVFADAGGDEVESRMFYGPRGGILEVAATGSGAANMGRWYAATGLTGIDRHISQGAAVGRPSAAHLRVDEDGTVYVGGRVNQVAKGAFAL